MKNILPIFLLYVSFSLPSYSQVDLTSGLVAYYPFNGDANDESGNGNHPIFNNAVLTNNKFGDPGKAYLFNGSNTYIRISNSNSLNTGTQISLCVYLKVSGFYSGPCHGNDIINKGQYRDNPNSYFLRFEDGPYTNHTNCFTPVDTLHQNFYGMYTAAPPPGYSPYIVKDQWYSVIYTYDGATAKLYVDGDLKFQNTVPGLQFGNTDDLFLGRLYDPWNTTSYPYWFNGVMDEVRIYNRALSQNEVIAVGRFINEQQGNTFAGIGALAQNTTGYNNTAYGNHALTQNTTGYNNTATGYEALYSSAIANDNTAYGANSLHNNITGVYNTASGSNSLQNNTGGIKNTASGFQSLYYNTGGNHNTATGLNALYMNTTGNFNIATGNYALQNNNKGSGNVAIGYSSGSIYNYSYSTFVGYRATTSVGGLHNVTVIGNGALATASNQVRFGNTAVTSIGGQVGWSTLSDGRYKKNVHEDVPGLSFINKLRAVTYTLDIEGLDKASRSSEAENGDDALAISSPEEIKTKEDNAKIMHTGFVAQEVEKVAKGLKYDFSGVDAPKNGKDFYGLRYSEFVVPLVKAVQELSKENEELKRKVEKIDLLEKDIADLKKIIAELKGSNGLNPSATISSAYIEQSRPNPSNGNLTIGYYLPANAAKAKIIITDMRDRIIKTISLVGGSAGQVNLNNSGLAAGTYNYSLWINDKKTDSKQMIIAR